MHNNGKCNDALLHEHQDWTQGNLSKRRTWLLLQSLGLVSLLANFMVQMYTFFRRQFLSRRHDRVSQNYRWAGVNGHPDHHVLPLVEPQGGGRL